MISHLKQVTWSCIHFASTEEVPCPLDISNTELVAFQVAGNTIKGKEDLLSAIAKEMEFPSYFGGGWDAFHDCLRDMSWKPASGYVLFIHQAQSFWSCESNLAGKLTESWLFCAEYWANMGTPFHLVFVW